MHFADADTKLFRLHSRYIFCVHAICEARTHHLVSASAILGLKTRTPLVRWENSVHKYATFLDVICMLLVITSLEVPVFPALNNCDD